MTKKKEIDVLTPVVRHMLHQVGDENLFRYLIFSLEERISDIEEDISQEEFYAKHETNAYAGAKKEARETAKALKAVKKEYLQLVKSMKKSHTSFLELKKWA